MTGISAILSGEAKWPDGMFSAYSGCLAKAAARLRHYFTLFSSRMPARFEQSCALWGVW